MRNCNFENEFMLLFKLTKNFSKSGIYRYCSDYWFCSYIIFCFSFNCIWFVFLDLLSGAVVSFLKFFITQRLCNRIKGQFVIPARTRMVVAWRLNSCHGFTLNVENCTHAINFLIVNSPEPDNLPSFVQWLTMCRIGPQPVHLVQMSAQRLCSIKSTLHRPSFARSSS